MNGKVHSGHGDRHVVSLADGTWQLHVKTPDGDFWDAIAARDALYFERLGATVTIIGNGLLALSFPGCSTATVRCQCKPLKSAVPA